MSQAGQYKMQITASHAYNKTYATY